MGDPDINLIKQYQIKTIRQKKPSFNCNSIWVAQKNKKMGNPEINSMKQYYIKM